MSGFLFNGVPQIGLFTGAELMGVDTQNTQGLNPESGTFNLAQLATIMGMLGNRLSHATVAGTIYYAGTSFGLNPPGAQNAFGVTTLVTGAPLLATGVEVMVGATGGTDKWTVGVYNSAGALVAVSDTATGITAGTANTVQRLPFGTLAAPTPVTLPAGNYFLALQSNGTTATFMAINSPVWPYFTGSQTGAFGTMAAISPLPTSYTANIGPAASLY